MLTKLKNPAKTAAKCITDPKWRYKSELRDLIKYHRFGGWSIPLLVAFPAYIRIVL